MTTYGYVRVSSADQSETRRGDIADLKAETDRFVQV